LSADNQTLVQRYIAAYFYFATTSGGMWNWRNPAGNSTYCVFKKQTGVDPSSFITTNNAMRWLSNTPECEWAGIRCDKQHQITNLHFDGNNLTGTFPEGIFYLPFLQYLQ